jgi:hypothetical protein
MRFFARACALSLLSNVTGAARRKRSLCSTMCMHGIKLLFQPIKLYYSS